MPPETPCTLCARLDAARRPPRFRGMDTDDAARARSALDAAVADLVRACAQASLGVPEPDTLAEEIRVVGGMVSEYLAGAEPPDPPAAQVDRAGVLEGLRVRTMEAWEGDEGLGRLVHAFESTRKRLVPADTLLPPGTLSPYGHRLLREVAHMMRSPLGSVVMLAATLRQGIGGDLTELQDKHLGLIHRAVVSLAAMSNDLLALTGEDAELRAEPAVFSVEEAVRTVSDAIAPVAEERGVDLRTEVAGIGKRLGRESALKRALVNLALNGVLLVREGVLELTAGEAGEADVRFRVRATAASEDPATLFVVFPPQGDTNDYTIAPRGLGFAVARDVVRRMGSELQVERPPEGGLELSFTLRLPAAS